MFKELKRVKSSVVGTCSLLKYKHNGKIYFATINNNGFYRLLTRPKGYISPQNPHYLQENYGKIIKKDKYFPQNALCSEARFEHIEFMRHKKEFYIHPVGEYILFFRGEQISNPLKGVTINKGDTGSTLNTMGYPLGWVSFSKELYLTKITKKHNLAHIGDPLRLFLVKEPNPLFEKIQRAGVNGAILAESWDFVENMLQKYGIEAVTAGLLELCPSDPCFVLWDLEEILKKG